MRCLDLYKAKRKRKRASLERAFGKLLRDEKPKVEDENILDRRLIAHNILRHEFLFDETNYRMWSVAYGLGVSEDPIRESFKILPYACRARFAKEYRRMVLA